MTFKLDSLEDFALADTSSNWRVFVGDLANFIVWAEGKSAAWGTAVLAVKVGPTANGPFLECVPAIRIGPPASGNAVCTPLMDGRGVGYVEVSVATAEGASEFIRLYVTGDKP